MRGFYGFGSAMVFLPVAGQFLSPITALTVLTVMDTFGPFLAFPRALQDAGRADLLLLVVAMILMFPVAFWILMRADPVIFR